jgi:hypothetical protein
MALAFVADWLAVLLTVGLLLSWWGFLAWWISRYGARDVSVRFRTAGPALQALAEWRDYYGIWLAGAGYHVIDERPERVALVGRYRPRWEIALAVLLFPLGLIFLLGVLPADLVATAENDGITVDGKVHRRMARELERPSRAGPRRPSRPR